MEQKRIAIFGGSGFVGRNLAHIAHQQGWRVYIVDSFEPRNAGSFTWLRGDITNPEAVDALIEQIKPDAVVNLAAISDIDKAEANQELTWKVNVLGAANIAQSCARYGGKYLFFSSDAVFSGTDAPYSEESVPNPVNYYGKSKLSAENEVLKANPNAIIIRISLIVGFAVDGGNSFLEGLTKKLSDGIEISCAEDEIRTPIDVTTLCECVLELVSGNFLGIVHLGSTQSIDRLALTETLARLLGYDTEKIKRQDLVQTGRAPRHKQGIIKVSKAQSLLNTPLLSIEETLFRAVSSRARQS